MEQDHNEHEETDRTVDRLPVNRDYDFKSHVPTDVPEYLPHNGEKDRMIADIENRDDSGRLPRYLIGGPTGCGKTLLARTIAQERDAPLFTIQGKYALDETDLLGHPMLVNDSTIWSDGTLTKALLASQEQEVVLLIDEANRARAESKGVLFSALDERCQVELDGRGGEVIKGNPQNLIVIATINEGDGYRVQEMDRAEKRRFGNKWDVDYLGFEFPDREVSVVAGRTPAGEKLAEYIVKVANEIRREARNDESVVSMGVPTSNVISWAQTAYAYAQSNFSNPLVESARDSFVRPLYEDEREREKVLHIVRDHLDEAPFDESKFNSWAEHGVEVGITYECHACGKTYDSNRGLGIHMGHEHPEWR